ncbi:MAG: asparagine--tRNA ligase [Victivallales bacterium]|nr:asparagine--tRNA ligase [Victivallales bacterium]MBR4372248.1 asparagine--tRNA ligase [Victivallales bacterium]MBR4416876.1 asparagine--tRNA ligase [Victivallales bacterium]MBR5080553.1 asparagine--tRNA ligase [Victivallales bacterium]MBR5839295.1 asparagine--tRNA ligase [Victivallales bacterium]
MKRTVVRDALSCRDFGSEMTVAGWVRTRRDSKAGFSFIELNDGSCQGNLQVVAPTSLPNYDSEIVKLHPGASVKVTGTLVASEGKGQAVDLKATEVKVLGFCDPMEYPLGKTRISFERLREVAHLRPRTNTFGAVARVRNTLAFATHEFFQGRGFYYFNAPLITASDCEGAGEMFQVTTLDIENPPRDKESGRVDFSQDFFGRPANLTVSGQLEAETYACALGSVYTFGPTFRAENSNTTRHLAEFWMIEPEVAFADLHDDADLAEDYLRYLFRAVLKKCPEELQFFNDRIEKGLLDNLTRLADAEFTRITYTEAIKILEKAADKFEFKPSWGVDLQSEHERYLAEETFHGPVIVMDYPRDIKAFYMRLNDDQKTVAAMDVLLPNVGEIIGGSQREERLDVLERRIRETGMDPKNYWWYCDLRRFGSVPHAGFGLGFERMVRFCTGMGNIRDVIPYPRTPQSAEF